MAAATVLPAMNGDGDKSIHPFFRKSNGVHEPDAEFASSNAKTEVADVDETAGDEDQKPAKSRSKRKSNGPAQPAAKGKKQKTLAEVVDPKAEECSSEDKLSNAADTVAPDSSAAAERPSRKRRRPIEEQTVDPDNDAAAASTKEPLHPPSSPRVIIPAPSPLAGPAPTNHVLPGAPKTPPKKVLRLNANGKFSSPISKGPRDGTEQLPSPGAKKRKGRPKRSKEAAQTKQRIVTIAYTKGKSEADRLAFGEKIDRILGGEQRSELEMQLLTPRKRTPKSIRTPKKSNKPTHPFFVAKAKEEKPKHESPRKASATTPGKLRRQVFGERLLPVPAPEVPYAVGSALLKDRQMVKHPGAREPPWPDREQVHVRGLGEDEAQQLVTGEPPTGVTKGRKGKAVKLPLTPEESVLRHVASSLKPEPNCEEREDGFAEPHASLRLPHKLLISGHDIRQRVATELSVPLFAADEDKLSQSPSPLATIHAAVQKLWHDIPTTTTAFDEGRGETLPWTHKYAPGAAAEVLQPWREMRVLKEWLTSLTITAVESTLAHPVAKPASKHEAKPKKKKRRKADDLDDFLVDDDEDIRNMDELSVAEDPEADGKANIQRSVVQAAIGGGKLSNAVLLSGNHGCGKTAAAYAVAKELGFRVFDISPNERRSGKDVLDKVGDMTENHMVKHHGVDVGEPSATDDTHRERLDEEFQRDLASGRQGKMNAFFKPKAATVVKPAIPKQKLADKTKTLEQVQKALRKPPKDQAQSLILLEEVDLLFRDDKDFWTTVFKLIVTSKRPFIMTCNDEDLVPYQAMNLHAILRFTPPPVDLATDYLLLIAAAEGHLLKRNAVDALLRNKQLDLRSSLMELDFWCQMGVGDPRGGLSWIYQRWPPGSDVDKHGRKLRMTSDGTYQSGMGQPDDTLSRHDQLMWAWREFGVDPFELPVKVWEDRRNQSDGAGSSSGATESLADLKEFDRFAGLRSCMDVYTKPGLSETTALDTTRPDMTEKARSQYIEGLRLLQTDEAVDYSGLSMDLTIATACLLSEVAAESGDIRNQVERLAPDSTRLFSVVVNPSNAINLQGLHRQDFGCFDPISATPETALSASPGLIQSVFDGPLEPIATDLAPYVRSIVQYDMALEEQRERLNDVLADEGGPKGGKKRARTTRAARSALEGSQRSGTRRERWFTKALDLHAVLATGGSGWPKTGMPVSEVSGDGSDVPPASSGESA